ncbi:hypothetical protein OO013_04395 [Mangrovivirga sp. M17]|uniref:Uncharacterized protein n=1 Tax=Mangrovivirga halotolerans TaxID=2993936 RepID=A0ABT3RMP4_9BACT|nr:hypothetical protein [Mangrovivirga halotolerans]MCX2743090.1 hypothetical protein [Mangrovivirga halotolerans]
MKAKSDVLRLVSLVVLILIVLVLCIKLLFDFRKIKSFETAIAKDAGVIIRLNTDKIFRKVTVNAILHPGYYLSSDDPDSLQDQLSDHGILLPGNVFIFSLEQYPGSYYMNLPYEDHDKASAFVKKLIKTDTLIPYEGILSGVSEDGTLQAALKNNRFIIAYHVENQLHGPSAAEMFDEEYLDLNSDPVLQAVKKSRADLLIYGEKERHEINFNNGEITWKGTMMTRATTEAFSAIKDIGQRKQGSIRKLLTHITGVVIGNDDAVALNKLFEKDIHDLDIYIGGTTRLLTEKSENNFSELNGFSSLSNDYRVLPAIQFRMISSDKHDTTFIDEEDKYDFIPLFRLDPLKPYSDTVLLSNMPELQVEKFEVNNKFLDLNIDFDSWSDSVDLPVGENLFDDLSYLNFEIIKESDQYYLSGHIRMDNKSINSFVILQDLVE